MTKLAFCIYFAAILSFGTSPLIAHTTNVLIEVSGIARGSGGKYFATLRGYGVVQDGDIISIATEKLSCKVRIASISQMGLQIETFDVVNKLAAKAQNPQIEARNKYDTRDPFWPIDYDPVWITARPEENTSE